MSVQRLCLECADREGRLRRHGRLGPEAEESLIERPEQRRAVAVLEHRDERRPDEIGGRGRRVAGRQQPEPVEDRRALAGRLTENGSRTQRPGEQPLAAAEQ